MDDIVKSIKAHLYERASSPLVFTFICSWLAWNYRLVIIIFSGASPSDKFLLIDMLPQAFFWVETYNILLTSSILYWLVFAVLGPLCTTTFYLIALPKIEERVFELTQANTVRLKNIKLRHENETPISENERMKLRQELRNAEKRLDDAIETQKALLRKDSDLLRAELATSKALADENFKKYNEESIHCENLKNTVQELKGELDEIITFCSRILFLDTNAHLLFDRIAESKRFNLPLSTSDNYRQEMESIAQLEKAGLIEIHNEVVEITSFGLNLNLKEKLRNTRQQ